MSELGDKITDKQLELSKIRRELKELYLQIPAFQVRCPKCGRPKGTPCGFWEGAPTHCMGRI